MSTDEASAAVEEAELPADKYICKQLALPTLQKMAAHRVAVSIWQICKIFEYDGFDDKMEELVKAFKAPSCIEKMLKEYVYEVRNNVYLWKDYFCNYLHDYHFMYVYESSSHDNDSNCLVWYPNGEIDYKKTALNELLVPGLSEIRRFTIMAVYCMEDELKTFSLRSLPQDFIDHSHFDADPLLYYWIRCLKGKLHEIPTNNFNSIDATMAAKIFTTYFPFYLQTHWTAFEYFWHRLGTEDEISVAKSVLDVDRSDELFIDWRETDDLYIYVHEEQLISKMSWQQQRRLLYPIPDQIVLNLCIRLDSPEFLCWAWKHCRNHIPNEYFGEMVKLILRHKIELTNRMQLFDDIIWSTAPAHLRDYVIKNLTDDIVSLFRFNLPPISIKFIREFLSLKSVDFRKDMIFKKAAEFTDYVIEPSMMVELLNFFLPNSIDQSAFKRLIMTHYLKKSCQYPDFLRAFESLDLKLQFYASNVNDAREFKKWFVECDYMKKNFHHFVYQACEWYLLDEFIDDIYPDDPSLAYETKKRIILSFAADQPDCDYTDSCECDAYHNLTNMKAFVEQLSFTTEVVKTFKRNCLSDYKRKLDRADGHYWKCADNFFHKFVSWCLDDEAEEILAFKKSFSADVIFDVFINYLNAYSVNLHDFKLELSRLDERLKWCFASTEELKQYKLSLLDAFDEGIFEKVLQPEHELCAESLLKWIFDDDVAAILKFKRERLCQWKHIFQGRTTE